MLQTFLSSFNNPPRYSSQDGSLYDVDVGGFCGQFLPYLCKSKKIIGRLPLTIYFDLHLQNDK